MGVPVGYKIFSKIVHNDAMKKDPPEIYGWRAIALAGSVCNPPYDLCSKQFTDNAKAGFGAMLFGMDSSIISGVVILPSFMEYVHSTGDCPL